MKNLKIFILAFILFTLPLAAIASDPVNINTADAQTLASSLKGIGLTKAKAIVAHREANGPFESADDLMSVKGIGEMTVDSNRDRIRVE